VLFSIITATYNSEDTILDCINSVKNQQTENKLLFEHIIIDGCSNDRTLNILDEYSKNINVKLISEKDGGIYDALNKGIKLAKGLFVMFLHSDDKLYDTKTLQKIHNFTKNKKDIFGLYSNLSFISNGNLKTRIWKSSKFNRCKINFGWTPPHPTLILKKDIYKKLEYFDTSFKISSDYDFIHKLFRNYTNILHFDTITYLMGNEGISSNKNLFLKIKEDYIVLNRYYNKSSSLFILIAKRLIKIKQFKIW